MDFSTAAIVQNESNHKQPNTYLSNDETAFAYNFLNEALDRSNIEISTTSSYKASSITATKRSNETNRPSFSDVSSSKTLSSVVPVDAGNNLIHSLKSR